LALVCLSGFSGLVGVVLHGDQFGGAGGNGFVGAGPGRLGRALKGGRVFGSHLRVNPLVRVHGLTAAEAITAAARSIGAGAEVGIAGRGHGCFW
jgi:hypothetical protein